MTDQDPIRRRIRFSKAVSSRSDTVKPQPPIDSDSGTTRSGKRSFNEAAHKLGHVAVGPAPRRKEHTPSDAFRAATDDDRDVVAHAGKLVLSLGALGVVYGDLGTSPLYTVQTLFSHQYRDTVHATPVGVYGVTSLVFWALIIIASIKYAGVIMRAHNRGDGGVMALAALIRRKRIPRSAVLVESRSAWRGTVPGRRDDHSGDHRHLGDRGPQGRHARHRAVGRADRAGDPHRAVPGAEVRDRGRRLAVRSGPAPVVFGDRRPRRGSGRGASRRVAGAVADLGRAVHPRPRGPCVADAGRRRPVCHRRRGAVRRPRALRCGTDPDRLVRHRPARRDAQLPRTGRADPGTSRRRPQPLLPARARLGAAATCRPGDARLRDRLSVSDQRRLLGGPPGRPARLPAAAASGAHLRDGGADLRPDGQLGADDRRRRARARLPLLHPPDRPVRHGGDRHVRARHDSVRRGRPLPVADQALEAGGLSPRSSTSSSSRSSPRTSRRSRTALGSR